MRATLQPGVQAQLLPVGIHQQELAAFVQNAETAGQRAVTLVVTQQVSTQGMDCPDGHLLHVDVKQLLLDAVFELKRGFVGEGGDEAMRGRNLSISNQMSHSPGNDLGLARARARDDE